MVNPQHRSRHGSTMQQQDHILFILGDLCMCLVSVDIMDHAREILARLPNAQSTSFDMLDMNTSL